MAHFAELDSDNKVLRVVVACNQDIADNGGEQSAEAAEHFKTVLPLTSSGVKWVQTSYNNNFSKQFAGRGILYNPSADVFYSPKPFPSWTLDENHDWNAPVTYPSVINDSENEGLFIAWDEENQKWTATGPDHINKGLLSFDWNTDTSSWDQV